MCIYLKQWHADSVIWISKHFLCRSLTCWPSSSRWYHPHGLQEQGQGRRSQSGDRQGVLVLTWCLCCVPQPCTSSSRASFLCWRRALSPEWWVNQRLRVTDGGQTVGQHLSHLLQITVSSGGMLVQKLRTGNLQSQMGRYDGTMVYAQNKVHMNTDRVQGKASSNIQKHLALKPFASWIIYVIVLRSVHLNYI